MSKWSIALQLQVVSQLQLILIMPLLFYLLSSVTQTLIPLGYNSMTFSADSCFTYPCIISIRNEVEEYTPNKNLGANIHP